MRRDIVGTEPPPPSASELAASTKECCRGRLWAWPKTMFGEGASLTESIPRFRASCSDSTRRRAPTFTISAIFVRSRSAIQTVLAAATAAKVANSAPRSAYAGDHLRRRAVQFEKQQRHRQHSYRLGRHGRCQYPSFPLQCRTISSTARFSSSFRTARTVAAPSIAMSRFLATFSRWRGLQ